MTLEMSGETLEEVEANYLQAWRAGKLRLTTANLRLACNAAERELVKARRVVEDAQYEVYYCERRLEKLRDSLVEEPVPAADEGGEAP